MRVDVTYARWGPRGKAWVDVLGTLVFLLPFAVAAVGLCAPSAANSWAIREGSPDPGGLARYPIKALVLAAFAWHVVQGAAFGWRRVGTLLGKGDGTS